MQLLFTKQEAPEYNRKKKDDFVNIRNLEFWQLNIMFSFKLAQISLFYVRYT